MTELAGETLPTAGQAPIGAGSTGARKAENGADTPSATATDATPTPADSSPAEATTDGSASGQTAGRGATPSSPFALGWAMAQLYGPVPGDQTEPNLHLASVNELNPGHRLKLALAEIHALAEPLDCADQIGATEEAWKKNDKGPFQEELRTLHQTFLQAFVSSPDRLAAYQAGRALSDTCWLPRSAGEKACKVFFEQFNPYRMATVGGWLQEGAGVLPAQSAAVASRSIDNWLDWADVNAKALANEWDQHRAAVQGALISQETAWKALLAGTPGSSTAPSVQAWVRAGESVMRSARSIVRQVVARFWPLAFLILAATGGLMYLAISQSQGTMKAWTGLLTALGSVGVSAASLKAGAQKVAKGIEQEVWNAASLDARAWAVTWLPPFPTRKEGPIRRFKMHSRGLSAGQAKSGLTAHSEGPRQGE